MIHGTHAMLMANHLAPCGPGQVTLESMALPGEPAINRCDAETRDCCLLRWRGWTWLDHGLSGLQLLDDIRHHHHETAWHAGEALSVLLITHRYHHHWRQQLHVNARDRN